MCISHGINFSFCECLYNVFLVKKDTLKLQKYEETLLQYYKKYLQKLEKFSNVLVKQRQLKNVPLVSSVSYMFIISMIKNMCFTRRN